MDFDLSRVAHRRAVVTGIGATITAGLAGCLSQSNSGSSPATSDTSDTTAMDRTADGDQTTSTENGDQADETTAEDVSAPSTVSGTWPIYYEGNPDGSNRVAMTGPEGELVPLWTRDARTLDLVLGDGYIFGSRDGQLRALDAATGETAWTASGGSPWYAGGTVFDALSDSVVRDATTGEPLWRTEEFVPRWTDGDVPYGTVYDSQTEVRRLQRRDPQNGTLDWEYELPADSSRTQQSLRLHVVDPDADTVIATAGSADENQVLLGIDRESGRRQWLADASSLSNIYYPLSDGERLYVVTDTGLVAIPYDSSTPDWQYDPDANLDPHRVAVADSRVFVVESSGRLVGLDRETGAVTWEQTLGEVRQSNVFVGRDSLFVSTTVRTDGSWTYRTFQVALDGTIDRTVDGVFTTFVSEELLFGVTNPQGGSASLTAYASPDS